MASAREFDILVFGASGFTGKFVAAQVLKNADDLKWAVGGRSEAKLNDVIQSLGAPSSVGVVLADVLQHESLRAMARRTRVLLNCVGPYRFLGDAVVQACVEEGTDYLDISGEPEFLESTEEKYHATAKEKGCVIVGSCGFDSVPADIGTQFAKAQFEAPAICTCVETFMSCDAPHGYVLHNTTFECAVEGVASASQLKAARKKSAPKKPRLNYRGPKLVLNTGPFKDSRLPGEACFLFPGADASVIKRSEEAFAADDANRTSIYSGCYFHMSNMWAISKMILFGGLFRAMASTEFGRKALVSYPRVFTGGAFSETGPTDLQIKTATFTFLIFAKGFRDENSRLVCDKHVTLRVHGPDPGYAGTAIMLVTLGLITVRQRELLPRGGVFTPGYCFAKTNVTELLTKRGVVFEII